MFTSAAANIRMGLTRAKPSTIIMGGLYYFIAAVLLFSGVTKIIDPTTMIETMKAVFKITEDLLLVAATLLPIIEIALGLILILKIQTKKALLAITALFFCFFAFSVYGTFIGLNNDCGCFGDFVKSEFRLTMIIRNFVLLTIVSWLAVNNIKIALARRYIQH